MNSPILIAVDAVGGQSELARRLNVDPTLVSQWVHERRPIAAHHCLPIEQATDRAVTRYQLRPDVFGETPDEAA
jgi:DNA-binding transcriptional regulator YdaS (Cro superfamily)